MRLQGTQKLNLPKISIIILFLLVAAGQALAATYYVSPSGSDSNSGSISAPFKTIQKAANTVSAGDTAYVRAGTYNERVTLSKSGTAANYITFQNYTGETAILDGTGKGNGVMISGVNVSYVKVIGFKIQNYVGAGIQFNTTGSSGHNQSHIEIRDNEISNGSFSSGYGHSILFATWDWGSSNSYTDIIVDGNYIHNVVTGSPSAYNETITFAGNINRFQITNNTLDTFAFIGIDMIGHGSQYPQNGIVSGNIIKNGQGLAPSTAALYVDGGKNITVENNQIYSHNGPGLVVSSEEPGFITQNIIVRRNIVKNATVGMYIGASGAGGQANDSRYVHNTLALNTSEGYSNIYYGQGVRDIAKNNIFYFSGGQFGQMYVGSSVSPTPTPTLDYNNYYDGKSPTYYQLASGSWTGSTAYKAGSGQDAHSFNSNPLFTNLSTNDFTLQSSSPAINAGTVLTTVTSASGTGTSLTVGDARYFHNGYGITGVSGDSIMIGADTVTVTGVNYSTNVITFTPSITWAQGEGVSYPYAGAAADMGAYEYGGSSNPPPPSTDTTPPSVPTGLTATAISSSQINLSWTASTDNIGVSGYKLYRGSTLIATTTSMSYSDTALSASTTYTYKIAAYDVKGNVSSQSASASTTTQKFSDTQSPSVPISLTATATSSSQINLSWSASTDNVGVTGYRVYRNGTQIATTTTTSYSNTGLAASTTYSYSVAAYDATGNVSGQSASVSSKAEAVSAATATQPSPINVSPSVKVWLGAEKGDLHRSMAKAVDTQASGSKYIAVPDGKGDVMDPLQSGGYAVYKFKVPVAGSYIIWGRVMSDALGDGSFFVKMDKGPYALWDTAVSGTATWVWDQVNDRIGANPVIYSLDAGKHSLKIKQRTDGTKIDRILITNDSQYVPQNLGE